VIDRAAGDNWCSVAHRRVFPKHPGRVFQRDTRSGLR
jgi:hypothetical protein